MKKFCSVCKLKLIFEDIEKHRAWKFTGFKVFLKLEDQYGEIACLSLDSYDVRKQKCFLSMTDNGFVGNSLEESCKKFFKAFLHPGVYLLTTDTDAWIAAETLKNACGSSLEILCLNLDLRTGLP